MSVASSSIQKRPLPLRAWGLLRFVYHFFRELILANIHLAKVVLTKERDLIQPGFIEYPVGHLTKFEIFVLSHCITLTPGSATIEVSPDFTSLTLHILDLRVANEFVKSIQRDLEVPILRWTR